MPIGCVKQKRTQPIPIGTGKPCTSHAATAPSARRTSSPALGTRREAQWGEVRGGRWRCGNLGGGARWRGWGDAARSHTSPSRHASALAPSGPATGASASSPCSPSSTSGARGPRRRSLPDARGGPAEDGPTRRKGGRAPGEPALERETGRRVGRMAQHRGRPRRPAGNCGRLHAPRGSAAASTSQKHSRLRARGGGEPAGLRRQGRGGGKPPQRPGEIDGAEERKETVLGEGWDRAPGGQGRPRPAGGTLFLPPLPLLGFPVRAPRKGGWRQTGRPHRLPGEGEKRKKERGEIGKREENRKGIGQKKKKDKERKERKKKKEKRKRKEGR